MQIRLLRLLLRPPAPEHRLVKMVHQLASMLSTRWSIRASRDISARLRFALHLARMERGACWRISRQHISRRTCGQIMQADPPSGSCHQPSLSGSAADQLQSPSPTFDANNQFCVCNSLQVTLIERTNAASHTLIKMLYHPLKQ